MRRLISTKRVLLAAPLVVVALVMAGCANQFTGGGWINSSLGGTNANFGFTYKVTDPSTGAGQLSGSYADRDASGNPVVKFSFTGSQSDECFAESGVSCNDAIAQFCDGDQACIDFIQNGLGSGRCILAEFNYQATNPTYSKAPGQGVLEACDNGQNASNGGNPQPNSADEISLYITSGPYVDYSDEGNLQGGNLSAKKS